MDLDALAKMVLHGDHIGAEQWTVEALAETVEPKAIIDGALIPGMDEVGRRFKGGEYHLPEVLIAARAMKASLKHVRPLLSEADGPSIGRVVIGTVQGDLHDIGKNLVSMMLEGAGFEVLDLGVDVSPEAFVEAAEDEDTRLVCLSTLLTTTMPKIAETVKALDAAELRSGLKVMVGGAPVDQVFTDQIKADGYATDAPAAVELAKSLLGVGETS
ncbi:MAG TPA: corrinoid protein [Dehalococcoidia bacterium]|jgi:5-methyltetrahydrofolate--homocysteine methyltransferase|nr:cobalamin-binding protein [Chloroflexota bacterium]MDP5877877.1 corrinoid protein [Dehalococcoidia bacterium]MDP6273974.1 corrinoid protein [Dehalococcoidia bacterium]MDP7161654.1 corrinoid protein [Dehalococcoidia bacterium]MDP7214189.1 corrinoid protein [Dehalococcoidia bacterium]|tara:strand:- start:200 stop:844 length:645 start_codon:yes stop_codon:yes gene_type:complete